MTQLHSGLSQILDARPEQIDEVLTEYRNGNRTITPQALYMDLRIEDNPHDFGTMVHAKVNLTGIEYEFNEIVFEPVPLRLIMEYDAEYETMVMIMIEPIVYSDKTRITISTTYVSQSNFTYFVEDLLFPGNLHHIYEFQQFAQDISHDEELLAI